MNPPDDPLDELLERYFDAQLDPEQKARLEALLTTNAAARARFWEMARWNAVWQQWGEERWGRELPLHGDDGQPTTRRRWLPIAAALGLGVVTVGAALWWMEQDADGDAAIASEVTLSPSKKRQASQSEAGERTSQAVAVLASTAGVRWATGSEARTEGSALESGWLHLEEGLVSIEFISGARLLVKGPASVQIVSANEAYCKNGSVSAEVPPQARGFRLGTPQGTVVDLGTAFGLVVGGDGGMDMQVFEGEVEVHRAGGVREYRQGSGLRVAASGEAQEQGLTERSRFPSRAELASISQDAGRESYQRWKGSLPRTRAMPGLLAHYAFEPDSPPSRTLVNESPNRMTESDGSIVGAQWTEGRWPGKGALEFRTVGDRVRLTVREPMEALTLAAWVRMDAQLGALCGLFMSDAYNGGAVHWQVRSDGVVILGLKGRGIGVGKDYRSPVVFTPERHGCWMHLAVTVDNASGRVRHYVDGEVVADLPHSSFGRIVPGEAEIGNWNPGTRPDKRPIRNFTGRMDEFMFFQRALSADEVAALARSDSPAR